MSHLPRLKTAGVIASLVSANMNTTADQTITITYPNGAAHFYIDKVLVTNASASLTLAAGGIYTAASKGGTAVVAAAQVFSGLTGSGKSLLPTIAVTDARAETSLFLSLTTAQGAAATADLYILGYWLP